MNSETLSSLAAIVEQLAGCDYQCEAGPLVGNTAFIELRAGAHDEGCLALEPPCGDCAWCRMFGSKMKFYPGRDMLANWHVDEPQVVVREEMSEEGVNDD